MARPITEAPARSGVMLKPSCESTSSAIMMTMSTLAVMRMIGMSVRSRDEPSVFEMSSPFSSIDVTVTGWAAR